ncbi:MAG: outer membrane protein TolC [Gammaproteobacteria bacterium]|jgi:outer membrane protein TolC
MFFIPSKKHFRAVVAGVGVIALSGCATFSDDGGFSSVAGETQQHLGVKAGWQRDEQSREAARGEVAKLLEGTLNADAAMQIALLNNARLQAEYANLGLSEADLVQAGRIPNPGFSFGQTSGGGAQEIERGLHFSLLAILTIPIRSGIETRRFEAAKLAAAAATVETALAARSAYFEAVSAREGTAYFRQVVDSAEASRELMAKMARVGNSSRLDLAREQLFHAETSAALARAMQQENAAKEALVRKLGVWGAQANLQLPERLPELPTTPSAADNIEQTAIAQRFDVRQARQALAGMSSNLDLTQVTRFISVIEAGPAQVRDRGEPIRDGYEIALEIPLYGGGVKLARAEAMHLQALERLRATATDARSGVRQAYTSYRTAYDLAKHYRDEIVPLRKRISDEQLLRYNGMLISVFELIADSRAQTTTISDYLSALREFWLADTALKASMLIGNGPAMSASAASLPGAGNAGGH